MRDSWYVLNPDPRIQLATTTLPPKKVDINMRLPPVVGFAGPQGSGKDTCGEILAKNFNYLKAAFAEPVRVSLYALNPLVELDNGIVARLRTIVDQIGWDSAKRNSKDLRQLMQRMGTEAGRDIHGKDCWIRIASRLLANVTLDAVEQRVAWKRTCFCDVRFPNEVEFIKASGGIIIYVQKNDVPAQVANHRSEQYNVLDDADFILYNNGSISDLIPEIRNIFAVWELQ